MNLIVTAAADDVSAPDLFSDYLAANLAAMRMLEYQSRVPAGMADRIAAAARTLEPDGRPKALVAQLDPEYQRWVRAVDQVMRAHPEQVGEYGQGIPRPADI